MTKSKYRYRKCPTCERKIRAEVERKTPKEWRDLLFSDGRPDIREAQFFNDDGTPAKDTGVLWAAHLENGNQNKIEKEQFPDVVANMLSGYSMAWLANDRNAKFRDKYGPIGLVVAAYNGWELEPHFEPFPWATKRNKLRTVVAFLQMMKYDKSVGIVNVYSLDEHKDFFKRISKYGVLKFAGTVPDGDYRGDRHIFYIRGRSNERHW